MRESPWRSLVRPLLVASALVAVGACVPKLDLSNRPPPCDDGYSLCPATGACQQNVPAGVEGIMDPTNPGTTLPLDCTSNPAVRQGASILLPAPGARLQDVTAVGAGDITATPIVDGQGNVFIEVAAPHGAPRGPNLGLVPRVITITTTLGGKPFVRSIAMLVSFITAAPGGDDSAAGTLGNPFATLTAAAAPGVAAAGDTIVLREFAVEGKSGPLPGSGSTAVMVPDGVTIESEDPDRVPIDMELDLQGSATLNKLHLSGQRLFIRKPGSHVVFNSDALDHGLTVSTEARTSAGQTSTLVELTNTTEIKVPNQTSTKAPDSPLLIQADGATVTLDDSVAVTMPSINLPVETIRVEGSGGTLTISGARIENMDAAAALHVLGSAIVHVSGARFINPVVFEPSSSSATFQNVSFNAAPLTFNGHDLAISDNTTFSDSQVTFVGQTLDIFDTSIADQTVTVDLVANKPGFTSDVLIQNGTFANAPLTFGGHELSIQGSTSFTDSLVTFQGKSLVANDAIFSGQGILHDSEGSTSALTNVQVTNYKDFGYRLLMGSVNVMGGAFTHDPAVTLGGTSGPFALRIEAPGDTNSSVNSHSTLYDGVQAPPVECSGGIAVSFGTLLWVTDATVPISLCP